ncbi:glycerol-3-phosphate 1-O-acyltransferase PlsY [Chitinilyticum aquatile]|uniref:glycerol-3-phosphate 1-O-acyltransferase PlsY n=1 Tax=Chitinilyticum aquatile TaxID=362520 RepID=UPI0004208F04|nr:glycerol-3-phosphate 1-O-acyltransferase PlsY [Chitinilyticum aquatile]
MTPLALTLICSLVAYLLGSLSFAVIVSRLSGLADPRTYGSNNPGATNVLRSGNKKAAALTLLGDALKGLLAVGLVRLLAAPLGLTNEDIAIASVAVIVGHMWPVFFGFKGGKGVATSLGVLLALNGWMGLAVLAVWLFVAKVMKISSLSALCAALVAPLACWLFTQNQSWLMAVSIIAALLIWRHKSNIAGLLSGREGRIGQKADDEKN